MIGIDKALPVLLEGKHLSPTAGLELGIVDEVVAPEALHAAASGWIESDGNAEKTWYDKHYPPPGPAVQSPKGYEIFAGGNSLLHGKTRGNYPALEQSCLACTRDCRCPSMLA